jgi:hypothetical protein
MGPQHPNHHGERGPRALTSKTQGEEDVAFLRDHAGENLHSPSARQVRRPMAPLVYEAGSSVYSACRGHECSLMAR